MFSFLAVFPDTSIHQAFSMNTLHRWVSQMGRLRPKTRNSYEERQLLQRVSLSEDSLLSSQTSVCSVSRYPERQCFLRFLTGVKTSPTGSVRSQRNQPPHVPPTRFVLCMEVVFHLTRSPSTLLWHANALECPGLCCFPAKEPNKNSLKKHPLQSPLCFHYRYHYSYLHAHALTCV